MGGESEGRTRAFDVVLAGPDQETLSRAVPLAPGPTAPFRRVIDTPEDPRGGVRHPKHRLQAGESLGEVRLVRAVGEHSFEGVHAEHGRVFVRVLSYPRHVEEGQRHLLFARRRSGFRHAGLARVVDMGREPRAWTAEPWVDGPALPEALAGGRVPQAERYAWGIRVAEALVDAHAALERHGDVKPDDVLVGPEGPVLVGFGRIKPDKTINDLPGLASVLSLVWGDDPPVGGKALLDRCCDPRQSVGFHLADVATILHDLKPPRRRWPWGWWLAGAALVGVGGWMVWFLVTL